jgi:hypothetical protein
MIVPMRFGSTPYRPALAPGHWSGHGLGRRLCLGLGACLCLSLARTSPHGLRIAPATAQTAGAPSADDQTSRRPVGPFADRDHTLTVTTDTQDYCDRLQHKLDQAADPPAGVRQLRQEGRDMCADGRIRGGIARLRRALLALREK